MTKAYIFLLGLILANYSFAQNINQPVSNIRKKKIPVVSAPLKIDSLPIVAGSFKIAGVAATCYQFDYKTATLSWLQNCAEDSVAITYRIFPKMLSDTIRGLSSDSLMQRYVFAPIKANTPENYGGATFFEFGNFSISGIVGRGVSFGNAQDATINTNLNLQINGLLSDSLQIEAAISDDNLPIQPDGNTQQLNEFDRVFMRFKKRNWALQIGDIDIRQTQLHYLNFYKRLQGFSYEINNKYAKNITGSTLLSASVAKGKFYRNIIMPIEGNQGPYRLSGANNELFFIVLANSERVFIDGALLERGEDRDYVIDYNLAEISFTSKRLITKDSRIQVEFEYADRNYLNANIYAKQEVVVGKKINFQVGYFSNTDVKSSPINQSLNNEQIQYLSTFDHTSANILYPSERVDSFSAGKILYQKKYATTANGIDSFYIFSSNPDSALYSLNFIEVGVGQGNYVEVQNGANGKVFEYLPPINGAKQGRYAPAIVLVTPKKQELASVSTKYTINKQWAVTNDIAYSRYNVNSFSKVGNSIVGVAFKTGLAHTASLKNKHQWASTINYEQVDRKFKPLERLRSVEFTRDWGLPIIYDQTDEKILQLTTSISKSLNNVGSYQFTKYHRGISYRGMQHLINSQTSVGGVGIKAMMGYTNYKTDTSTGIFTRPTIEVSKTFSKLKNITAGFIYASEGNRVKNKATQWFQPSSFSFETVNLYFRSDEQKPNMVSIGYFTRKDKYPIASKLLDGDKSNNINLNARFEPGINRQLHLTATYRSLEIINKNISLQKAGNSFLGRVAYNALEFKEALSVDFLYEAGTGQEQKRDIIYIQTPSGKGTHTWLDNNNDSIQQLNEFEVATFADQQNFIPFYTPTNVYVKAVFLNFRYNFTFSPAKLFAENIAKKSLPFWSKLFLNTIYEMNRKSLPGGEFAYFPFNKNISDTLLITLQQSNTNTLSFNRQSNKWGIDLNTSARRAKSLLSYGYETRNASEINIKGRVKIAGNLNAMFLYKKSANKLASSNTLFDNKNYHIKSQLAEPSITYFKTTVYRVSTSYRFENRRNILGDENATINSINIEMKYAALQSSAITFKWAYSNIKYPKTVNAASNISYIILDALQPGNNMLWGVMITRRLFKNLELNMQYDGRKPANTKIINNGRVSVAAIF